MSEGSWPVADMRSALGAARRGHCAWRNRPPSAHDRRDAELARLISQVREEVRGIYGAPKVHMRLRALGVRTSRKRVARIMRERGWRGVTRRCAKGPSREKRVPKKDSAEDLVKRDFSAEGPNRVWFADITYVKVRTGWLYLAIVMDIWSRRIAGMVDGAAHRRRARRRRAQDGNREARARRGGAASITATTAPSTSRFCCRRR